MRAIATDISEVKLIEPAVFEDSRGLFFESYNQRAFAGLGITEEFVQDNQSLSRKGVLRGLHYQIQEPQGKLVRCVRGEIFDVAVDLRRHSATFGHWEGHRLSAANRRMLWIPVGFAHGFLTLSEAAEVLYKATAFYAPRYERTILWRDPAIHIDWPLDGEPILSGKDSAGLLLRDAEVFEVAASGARHLE